MKYSEIVDRVAEYLDRTDLGTSSSAILSATKIGQWVNDCRKDIALKPNSDFNYLYEEATISTSAGSAVYSLPSDYLGHLTLICDYKKLIRVGAREFDERELTDDAANTQAISLELQIGTSTSDFPEYYIDRGMYIELWPKPDAAYTITMKYYAQPEDFESEDDEDYMSRFHFEAIIFGASLRGAIFLDDTTKIQIFKSAYGMAIDEIVKREKDTKARDKYVRMKSWKDYPLSTFRQFQRIKQD